MPAMLDGRGNVVRPDFVSIYYKRLPASDPRCQQRGKACVDLPRGLCFVFGYDMVTGTQPTGAYYSNCPGAPNAVPGHYKDLTVAAPMCGPTPAGAGEPNRLGAIINAPECWNGRELDTPNHRDHMAYQRYENDGQPHCPATHPYIVPTFTLSAWYDVGDVPIGQPGSVSTWSISSGAMNMGGKVTQMTPGSTFHADWDGAWDDATMATWTANCINKLLNCSAGDLGDGTMMQQDRS